MTTLTLATRYLLILLMALLAVSAPRVAAQEGQLQGRRVAVDGEMHGMPVPGELDGLRTRIDSIRRANHVPAVQVAVIRPDTTVLWNFGVAAPGRPVTDSTLFRVGSISKTFAGISMLMLAERGRVSLDTPLAELAPELPIRNPWRATHPVRLSHLLEAGAGFVGFHDWDDDGTALEPDRFLETLPFRLDVQWRPGDYTAYHNLGPVVTAYLVEKLTGEAYEDFVRENLFAPLGMTRARFSPSPTVLRLLARPPPADGDPGEGGDDDAAGDTVVFESIGGYWPSGGLTTSARELTALVRTLLDRGTYDGRRLLSRASIERFETSTTTLAVRKLGLSPGHGINNWTTHFRGVRYQGHGGRMDGGTTGYRGYSAYHAYAPGAGTGFVYTGTEGSSGEEIHYPVMEAILSHLHPEAPTPAAPVTEDELGDVAGCWELANPRSLGEPLERIEIRPVNGIMRMDEEGRPELRWTLEHTARRDVFRRYGDGRGPRRGRPDDALVAFVPDDHGTLVMQALDHPHEAYVRTPCR